MMLYGLHCYPVQSNYMFRTANLLPSSGFGFNRLTSFTIKASSNNQHRLCESLRDFARLCESLRDETLRDFARLNETRLCETLRDFCETLRRVYETRLYESLRDLTKRDFARFCETLREFTRRDFARLYAIIPLPMYTLFQN